MAARELWEEATSNTNGPQKARFFVDDSCLTNRGNMSDEATGESNIIVSWVSGHAVWQRQQGHFVALCRSCSWPSVRAGLLPIAMTVQ
jgi:hypothetical protein